jgi:hypothetical protein
MINNSQEDRFPFFKKLIFIFVFFTITPLALVSSTLALVAIANTTSSNNLQVENSIFLETPISGAQVYASLPSTLPNVSGEVLGADARSELIRQYLKLHHSPLEPYASFIVKTADKYELDYRLTTAIAQKESNLCKSIPENSHNCWGWGIHSEGTLIFDSFEESIEVVSKGIKEKYIDEGYTTPVEIMSKYTPLSKGTWAEGVIQFMEEIK